MNRIKMILLALPAAMLCGGCGLFSHAPEEPRKPVVPEPTPKPITMPTPPKPVTPGEIFVSHGMPGAEWFAEAKVLRTPELTIYYKGTLAGDLAPDGKHWVGDVKGEVVVKSTKREIVCTHLHVDANDALKTDGPARIMILDAFPQ